MKQQYLKISDITPDRDPKENFEKIYAQFLDMHEQAGSPRKPAISIGEIWAKTSLESNKLSTGHVNMQTPYDAYKKFKGSFLITQPSTYKLEKTNVDNLDGIDWIVMGGMDFYTPEFFGALRKYFTKFHTTFYNTTPPSDRVLYYYPNHPKDKRHKLLVRFHDSDCYHSAEMYEFAQLYVIPKILKGQKLKFFCFSASCRELLMIERACRSYLKKEISASPPSVWREQIEIKMDPERIMLQVQAFLFGHAFDWSSKASYVFQKLSIISLTDFGILRTEANRKLLYGTSIFSSGINMILEDNKCHNAALILSPQAVPFNMEGKINFNGHGLGHYVEAVTQYFKHHPEVFTETRIVDCVGRAGL